MSLEKPPHKIFYIGKKSIKHDTVAGTGLIWSGYGDSHMVPHSSAILLMQHVDVWCGTERFKKLNPDLIESASPGETSGAGLSSVGSQPQLQSQVAVSPALIPATLQLQSNATDQNNLQDAQLNSKSDLDDSSQGLITDESSVAGAASNAGGSDGNTNTNGSASGDQRQALVINAILSLDKSNPEHFSPQTGNPIIAAVRDSAGDQEISVKEVNSAWKVLNQSKAN